MNVDVYVCVSVYMCMFVCVFVSICVFVCMCVCIHMHDKDHTMSNKNKYHLVYARVHPLSENNFCVTHKKILFGLFAL